MALASAAIVAAVVCVFELIAASAVGASAPPLVSSDHWLSASSIVDAPCLAAAVASGGLYPAARLIYSAAAGISGPALRCRC